MSASSTTAGIDVPAGPLPGADVSLVIPDREMLRGLVEDVAEGEIVVALLQPAQSPLDTGTRSFVEFVTKDGLWRFNGRHRLLDRPLRDGVRGFVGFSFEAAPQLLQRREFIRTDHAGRITLFRLGDPDAVAEAGTTVNVSGGGLLVRGVRDAGVGDRLHFELHLEDDGPRIAGQCRAVRVTRDGHLGVQFTTIAAIDRDHIVHFAYVRERARREREIARWR